MYRAVGVLALFALLAASLAAFPEADAALQRSDSQIASVRAKDFLVDGIVDCGRSSGQRCEVGPFVNVWTSDITGSPERITIDVSWVLNQLDDYDQDDSILLEVRYDENGTLRAISVVPRQSSVPQRRKNDDDDKPLSSTPTVTSTPLSIAAIGGASGPSIPGGSNLAPIIPTSTNTLVPVAPTATSTNTPGAIFTATSTSTPTITATVTSTSSPGPSPTSTPTITPTSESTPNGQVGRQIPLEPAVHVPQGTVITYNSRPPSSGTHYPTWILTYGLHDPPPPVGNWVHNLEHGAIVILYNCPSGCPSTVSQLVALYPTLPLGTCSTQPKVLIFAYSDIDFPIVAISWGWVLEQTTLDTAAIQAFAAQHVDHGPECIP